MKKYTIPALLLIFGLLAASQCTGCAASPLETSYAARATFNQTVADLTAARKADVIDAQTFKADIALADTIVPSLDILDAAATNDAFNFWLIYEGVKPKLRELTTAAILAKGKK